VKRAVEADLARFKAYVELGETKELEFHAKPEEREGDESGDDGGSDESPGGQSRERERAGASA
jgi:hypothetical protein